MCFWDVQSAKCFLITWKSVKPIGIHTKIELLFSKCQNLFYYKQKIPKVPCCSSGNIMLTVTQSLPNICTKVFYLSKVLELTQSIRYFPQRSPINKRGKDSILSISSWPNVLYHNYVSLFLTPLCYVCSLDIGSSLVVLWHQETCVMTA